MKSLKPLLLFLVSLSMLAIPLPTQHSAEATHNEVNGCGSGSTLEITPDGIFANFTSACNNHDRCYGVLGQSRENCDNIFYNEMVDRCDSTYSNWWEEVSLQACFTNANLYYEAVRRGGGDAYREAQAHARSELEDPNGGRYALLCIHNETNLDVTYRFRWGNSSWQSRTVSRGRSRWHSHEYNFRGENRSPTFYIDFDYSLVNGENVRRDYFLTKTSALEQNCYQGTQYVFNYTNNSRRYIDLYKR